MIFRFGTEVLEDCLLPVSFHVIPVVNHSVSDGIVDAISGCFSICKGLVADEEIKVFDATLRR